MLSPIQNIINRRMTEVVVTWHEVQSHSFLGGTNPQSTSIMIPGLLPQVSNPELLTGVSTAQPQTTVKMVRQMRNFRLSRWFDSGCDIVWISKQAPLTSWALGTWRCRHKILIETLGPSFNIHITIPYSWFQPIKVSVFITAGSKVQHVSPNDVSPGPPIYSSKT
jgi:hypothetical protein